MTSTSPQRFAGPIVAAVCLLSTIASAQLSDDEDKPVDGDTGDSTVKERTLDILPNPLERWGVNFAATYIGEGLADTAGGVRPGASVQGRLNFAVDIDFEKAVGARGLSFHGNVFAIHGDQFTNRYLQSFMGASGIEGLTTVRLFEAWLEQKLANDRVSARAGQLSADAEFITTKFSDVFTNATFTWPAATAINLPSGGPATPLAALGARLRAKLTDNIIGMVAVYDGDPAGPGDGDPQERNRYGLNFRLRDPPLVVGQVEFDWSNALGKDTPGAFKLGGFRHFGDFDSVRFADDGRSLAEGEGDFPRQIDDGVAKPVGMVDGEDRLGILEQELVDELLEESLQPVADGLRFHDRPSDPLEVRQDRPQALGELVGLVSRLADG